ncbi:hypothetical protein [Hymenobacter terricola]|uniref:hypothetical protein n=1 Tax=Hymenobacter terricola TaxID=2819236 RepID=UPI001B302617|nr:hypothetical protein [Hymenobacter terricola]
MKGTLLFLLATLPAWAAAQANEASLLKAQKVTKLRVYAGTRLAATERYDPSGNVLASSDDSFLAETIRHSRAQQFNEENHVLWSKTTHSAMKDTTFWRYHYNERQQLISVTDGYTGKEVQRLAYDPAGRLARKTRAAATGQVLSEERFAYDEKGHETESTIDGSGINGRVKRTSYDDQDRPIREQLFDKGKLFFTQLTEYRSDGQKSQVLYVESEGTTGVAYRYGDNNRLLSRRHFTRDHRREVTTGTEAFTYTPAGLIETFAEDIFSFSHAKRTFFYQYN